MPIVITLIVLLAIYLYLVFPGQSTPEARAPFVGRNFAHRGLYDNEKGVPENSLAAFRAAMQAGYGCELDVQFTKDKKLIVFHDNDYKRACGVDKPVWELTFEEARQLSLFGTDERIPTFREVLDVVDGQNPLIVEINGTPRSARPSKRNLRTTRENGAWRVSIPWWSDGHGKTCRKSPADFSWAVPPKRARRWRSSSTSSRCCSRTTSAGLSSSRMTITTGTDPSDW